MINQAIPVQHIVRAVLITHPKLTMYSKPSSKQLEAATLAMPSCQACGQTHSKGCWFCLKCWEPLTVFGLANQIDFLKNKDERVKKLARYGWTLAEFHDERQLPGNAITALHVQVARRRGSQEPAYRPQTVGVPRAAMAKPAMAAPRWQPTAAPPQGGRPARPPRDIECQHLSDRRIYDLGKSARRGGHFLSHTDRYDRDDTYRLNCQNLRPPTPRRLQYMSREWAADDGSDF